MKIGILAYRQIPYVSANTAIAYIIGKQLSKHNEVIYIGHKQDKCQNNITEYYDHNKIIFLNSDPDSGKSNMTDYMVRLGLIHMAYINDIRQMRNIIKTESLDCLISIIAPIEDAYISMSINLGIPVYFYQLDPFYNQWDIENKRLKRIFLKYLNNATHLFTTDLLMECYKYDASFNKYLNKISVVQFPKLIKPQHYDLLNDRVIRLLYSGSLYADRKPEYLIELNKCLPANCKIVFCGECEHDEDKVFLADHGIICKGYCSQEVLADEMSKADIFINIGNKVKNQLPSKVIDYIATGKPIINLSQIDDCSSKKILKKYLYFLDLNVGKINQNKALVCDFIINNRNKKIPWDDIQVKFKEYTPQYVVEQIMRQIDYK